MLPLLDVASRLGLSSDDLIPFGRDKAKIDRAVLTRPRASATPAKLVLVSAITPTPAGEGKTTTSIGLSDALTLLGHRATAVLREPSLGPCFGVKGGGTGGGRSRLSPSDDINLHFNGDFHAITSAHNLLAAAIDNCVHFGTAPGLDARRVLWRRVIDMNDRSLRNIVVGLGGETNGTPREAGFDITAASELMAMLCLADDADDLRRRIDRTLVGFDRSGAPVTAGALGVTGAMLALLRDALLPNLVQTEQGTPAIVHGGPFANIAHGCNSVIATRTGLKLADWVVTEAGFGFDLGAEKFFDIKCRSAGFDPDAVVLVATARALKMHGGVALDAINRPDPAGVAAGLPNLEKHLESVARFGKPAVVALNRFGSDTDEELAVVAEACAKRGVGVAVCEHFGRGGEGALELGRQVIAAVDKGGARFEPLYPLEASIPAKIEAVARAMYGARGVAFTKSAERDLKDIDKLGYGNLPICVAKTQNSLSDDPKLRGRPRDFEITVRGLQINAGAGFIVVLTGELMRMPGLPKVPAAAKIDLQDGTIVGLS
ncbi:MAG: formate--tetrahydrofolate ligase [Nannocystaceae bacterium]